jgi:cytochrome P450
MMFIEYICKSPISEAAITVVILFVLWLVDYIFDSRVFDLDGKRIPGPRSNLYGKNFYNVVHEARKSKRSSEAIKNIMIPVLGDGNLCAQSLFGTNLIMLSHPDHIKTVLSGSHAKFPKGRRYERLKEFLGEGLITTNGEKWAMHRTIISPGFHADVLKHFPTLFSSHSNAMLRRWSDGCIKSDGHKTVDMFQEIVDLTLSIICDAGFGYTGESSTASINSVKKHFQHLLDEMNDKILDPFDWWSMFFPERQRRVKTAFSTIQTLMDTIILNRLQEYEVEESISSPMRPSRDLLDILVQASRGEEARLTASELRDHTLTFFAAGHETTSTTLLWVFYELVKQPEMQILCQEELDRVFPVQQDEEVIVAYEDISKCVYLGMVIKEALRLHPPAQLLARRTVEECQIGKYRVPPGI